MMFVEGPRKSLVRFRVEVTAEDIARGEMGSCSLCPVSLAIKRAIPVEFADVMQMSVYLRHEDGPCSWQALPPEVRVFVDRFDDGVRGGPFAFELDVPVYDPTEAR